MYDIIVVGGGPAGMTAALYGLRNGKKVLLIERNVFGGQIANSPRVENIPGFASISGDEFADTYLDQVMGQGADVLLDEVTLIEKTEDGFRAYLMEGEPAEGRTVILATGTTHRLLGLPGEDDLIGNGISFCAVCDGDFYAGRKVVMIGGGNSAFVEAVLLADIVDRLIMLQDMPYFTADQKLQDQLFSHDNIETHVETRILNYVLKNGQVAGVEYEEKGEKKIVECDGVFLAVGLIPDNGSFAEFADLDERGYFASDEYCGTRTPGMYVAGDCRVKSLRQVTTACGDGAMAAIRAVEFLNS